MLWGALKGFCNTKWSCDLTKRHGGEHALIATLNVQQHFQLAVGSPMWWLCEVIVFALPTSFQTLSTAASNLALKFRWQPELADSASCEHSVSFV